MTANPCSKRFIDGFRVCLARAISFSIYPSSSDRSCGGAGASLAQMTGAVVIAAGPPGGAPPLCSPLAPSGECRATFQSTPLPVATSARAAASEAYRIRAFMMDSVRLAPSAQKGGAPSSIARPMLLQPTKGAVNRRSASTALDVIKRTQVRGCLGLLPPLETELPGAGHEAIAAPAIASAFVVVSILLSKELNSMFAKVILRLLTLAAVVALGLAGAGCSWGTVTDKATGTKSGRRLHQDPANRSFRRPWPTVGPSPRRPTFRARSPGHLACRARTVPTGFGT